jgi:hypothetical protein
MGLTNGCRDRGTRWHRVCCYAKAVVIFIINELSAVTVTYASLSLAGETTEAFAMSKLTALTNAFLLLTCSFAAGGDWISAPSYYTHDPNSRERVTQYSPIGPFYTYPQAGFTRSGYRNTRSSLQVGTSADNYHTTEQWGPPVQPYGEWQFPFRPYSVPYGAWGPQLYGGFGGYPLGGLPYGVGGAGYGGGLPGAGLPGSGIVPPGYGSGAIVSPNPLQPGFSGQQQLLDGRYPPFDQLGPFEQKQLFDYLYPQRPEHLRRPGPGPGMGP